MSAASEARKHPQAVPDPTGTRAPKAGEGEVAADPVWATMMDGLSTYIRDHERLYRLLAR